MEEIDSVVQDSITGLQSQSSSLIMPVLASMELCDTSIYSYDMYQNLTYGHGESSAHLLLSSGLSSRRGKNAPSSALRPALNLDCNMIVRLKMSSSSGGMYSRSAESAARKIDMVPGV